MSGVRPLHRTAKPAQIDVSILTPPMSGVRRGPADVGDVGGDVSILTPPMSGVRQLDLQELIWQNQFQSSPHP